MGGSGLSTCRSELDPCALPGHGFHVILTSDLLGSDPGCVHGFTGRVDRGGVSLDLGSGASPETWGRAAETVGLPGAPVAYVSQVHGRGVIEATEGGLVGEADALITDVPGLLLAIRVADCVPVVVVGQGVVAAIHAGWRGLAAGIIPEVMGRLGPGQWRAAVGPRICVHCYEVGEEVVEGIAPHAPPDVYVRRDLGPRPHVDVGAAAAHQLHAAGVAEVDLLACCTRCSEAQWSHRQEGAAAGRQAGIVGLKC